MALPVTSTIQTNYENRDHYIQIIDPSYDLDYKEIDHIEEISAELDNWLGLEMFFSWSPTHREVESIHIQSVYPTYNTLTSFSAPRKHWIWRPPDGSLFDIQLQLECLSFVAFPDQYTPILIDVSLANWAHIGAILERGRETHFSSWYGMVWYIATFEYYISVFIGNPASDSAWISTHRYALYSQWLC